MRLVCEHQDSRPPQVHSTVRDDIDEHQFEGPSIKFVHAHGRQGAFYTTES